MSPLSMMFLGALATIAGVIILIQVYFDRVIKNYHILFHRDINFRLYENKEAKESIKEARTMFRNIGFFLLLVGVVLFTWGYIKEYGPNGNASLFSNNISEGIYKLDNEEGYFVQENSKTYDTIIVITADSIVVNGDLMEKDEFSDYVKGIDQVTKIFIKDDYAVASTYHFVEAALKNNEKTRNYETTKIESE